MKPVIAMPKLANDPFRIYMKSKYVLSLWRSGARVRWIGAENTEANPDNVVPTANGNAVVEDGILKAVREGILDESYKALAEKAVSPILECISDEGVVHQVSYGTPMGRISKDFYKNIELKPMPYGQALAMLFLAEYLNQEKQIERQENEVA